MKRDMLKVLQLPEMTENYITFKNVKGQQIFGEPVTNGS